MENSFTSQCPSAHKSLLTAVNTPALQKRCESSPQQCYLQHLRTMHSPYHTITSSQHSYTADQVSMGVM